MDKIIHLIKEARFAVALTGAGISTPSGIPDFRSERNGLWLKDDPMQVASLSVFRHNPQVFYDWLRPLVTKMQSAQPNPAHYALAQMEKEGFIKTVITQNIDGLHHRAGSLDVIKLHGSTDMLICLMCGKRSPTSNFIDSYLKNNQLPVCASCSSILKPDIVLYEELLPEKAWERSENQCKKADLLLIIGSSLEVSPVNRLPWITLQNGGRLVIINYSPTHLDDYAEVCSSADAAEILAIISKNLSGID